MENILTLSIAVGLVVSIIFSEILGIAAGGMIVPGYIALYLNNPFSLMLTLTVSLVTYFSVNTLSLSAIIYGRRKTAVTLLIAFFLGHLIRTIGLGESIDSSDINVIGYIIPGLIAIWMDKQGIVETFSALMTSSVIVRLILIILSGDQLKI